MDRRLLRGVRALRGQARRHGGDPVRDAVARSSTCSSPSWRCCGSARGRSTSWCRRRATGNRAGALDRRQRGDRRAWRRWSARCAAGFVVDCTIEGLMHAPETPAILKAGARIMVISNEHPEALERMAPDAALETRVRAAAKMLRGAKRMTRDVAGGTRSRCRHGRRADGRHLGLDREARHAGALAGRHRGELSEERRRQRHAGARPRRHQSHLQALSRSAGAADA